MYSRMRFAPLSGEDYADEDQQTKQERPSEASRNLEDIKKNSQESEQQSLGLSADRLKRSDNNSNQAGPSQQSSYDNSQSGHGNQPIDSAQHQQINLNSPDFIDSDDEREKNTELFSAIKTSNLRKVQELLKAGVKVNIIDKNNKNNTPLHYAIEREKEEVAAELLQKWEANINVQNNKGDTPLHIATRKGNRELVKLLLREKAKVNITNDEGCISLAIAKRLGKQDIVQILESNIQPNSPISFEEQSANRQKSQENLCSASSSGAGDMQSSSQPSSEQNSEQFKILKRTGTTGSLDGHLYEILLLILGKLRGDRDINNKFYLSTNVGGLGAFDDEVIKYWKNNGEEEVIILQAKHIENIKKKVNIEKFKNANNKKFYLGKYLSSYLIIRDKFNEQSKDPLFQGNSRVKYIIYTNAILHKQFDENRIIVTDNNIFSTKSKEEMDKAFKFSLGDINRDVIEMLENVSCKERIKLLAKALYSCISGKLNYNNMMVNEFFSTYHVFLAKNVIDVREEIKEDGKGNKYREGKINENFLNTDNEDYKKVLKKEVLYEYARNVIFNKKSSSILDDESKRNNLVNKVVKSLKSSKKVDEDVLEKLGGSVIILDEKKKQLKFTDEDKFNDCKKIEDEGATDEDKFNDSKKRKADEGATKFIELLKSKVPNLAEYEFDIPYDLVKKRLKEKMEKEPLMLNISFGNISLSLKKPKHLIGKLIDLFEKRKSQKVIKIDDSVVGHGKELTDGDIKNIGKLVGNMLIFDEKDKVLKLASEEKLNGDAREFIDELKSTARSKGLEVSTLSSYRFDIKVKKFPREIMDIEDKDKSNVKEFLSNLEVFTGQASVKDLEKIIKVEIRNLYKLTTEEVEDNFLKIRARGEKYWREDDYYLEKDGGFFANILKFGIAFDVKCPGAVFTGRKEELRALHNKISENVTVISGLGGIGKTELARKYAYDHKNDYDGNVIWIKAESYQTLVESFLRLAQDKLGFNVKSAEGNQKYIKSIVEDVYGFFSKRKSLFIFDNAEKLRTEDVGDEGIDTFLPRLLSNANRPYILITSRNQKWGRRIKVVPLLVFTEKDATDFIRTALNIKDDSQKDKIQKLMERFQRFPLALTQVVAYIKQADEEVKNIEPNREFKIDDYLKEYTEKTKELLNFPFSDDSDDNYSRTTFTTLEVTIDKIKKKEYGEKALEILNIIAYCAPDNIPTKIFLKLGDNDVRKLGATVQLLKQYSMVTLEKGVISVHRLVQEIIRINLMDVKREEDTLRKALESIKIDDFENEDLPIYTKLSNIEKHATYIWSYASKYDQLIKDYYSAYGKYGNTPLHLFAINGKKEAMESLLKNGLCEDKLNDHNQMGYTPFTLACLNGNREVVKYLDDLGVVIEFYKHYDKLPVLITESGNQTHVTLQGPSWTKSYTVEGTYLNIENLNIDT